MWNEYAKDDGVVLGIDDLIFVPNKEMTMIMSKPCLYAGLLSDDELAKEIIMNILLVVWQCLKAP